MGKAHVGSHAGNLMNMFSYLGVSQKPTGQHRGECEKVSDSQGPVPVPVHVFWEKTRQYLQSQLEVPWIIHACILYAFLFTFTKVRPLKESWKAEMWTEHR